MKLMKQLSFTEFFFSPSRRTDPEIDFSVGDGNSYVVASLCGAGRAVQSQERQWSLVGAVIVVSY
jgi:hypothetical protein